ncbi:MAG: phenylalanine--tRNA ligase subunit alpha [Candidatus Nezhaarchaeales archaeon]
MSRLELSEGETRILRCLSEAQRALEVSELVEKAGTTLSSVMSYLEALSEKGFVSVVSEEGDHLVLTDEGREYARKGLPERRIIEVVEKAGGQVELQALKKEVGMKDEEMKIALGWVRRKGLGEIIVVEGKKFVKFNRSIEKDPVEDVLKRLASGEEVKIRELPEEVLSELKVRKLVVVVPSKRRMVLLTSRGLEALKRALSVKVVGALTADMIKSGEWKEVYLKPYDVSAEPPKVYPARKHFYAEFLDKVRRILVEMGFVEAEGPYVELEFWNFDVLFQAQDHPAREIHDCFVLLEPSKGRLPDRELVEKVKKVHEEKWEYPWSEEQASRLVLRSHTTAVSARFLAERPRPPVKMFSISKVFRPDVIDATHFIEFTQVDGIYGDKGVNLKVLLGVLQDFAKRLGFKEVRFRPSYFPFTEPSVEGSVYHPQLGWIECLGAGMFRPEVLEALGIDYPVAAWGIGIDRLAMALLHISDIRELCSRNLNFIRAKAVVPHCLL